MLTVSAKLEIQLAEYLRSLTAAKHAHKLSPERCCTQGPDRRTVCNDPTNRKSNFVSAAVCALTFSSAKPRIARRPTSAVCAKSDAAKAKATNNLTRKKRIFISNVGAILK